MKCKVFIFLFFIIVFGCETDKFTPDNPLDPDNPIYEPPEILITDSPVQNETIYLSYATFSWEGNVDNMFFQYILDGDSSQWITQKSITIEYLDEGPHTFSIHSKYSTEVISSYESVNFFVDAVSGPALMIFPRRKITSIGENIKLQIIAEEIMNITGVEYGISFDQTAARVISIEEGEVFQGLGDYIFYPEFDNVTGYISMLIGFLGGDLNSVVRSDTLAIVEFRILKSGISEIEFLSQPIFKDKDNNPITILETIGGIINAQ